MSASNRVLAPLVLMLFASALPAAAQVGSIEGLPGGDGELVGGIEDLSLDALLGTVTAASRREESILQSPASVTVFESEYIRRSGAMDIPDLLRQVPGVQVQRSGPASVSVSLRGSGALTNNAMVVMVDGVPLSDPFDGSVDWSTLAVTLEDVRRIEVIRGPVSTLYGAGAYSGVVAITTWDRDRPPPSSANVSAGLDHEGHLATKIGGRLGSSGGGPLRFQVRGDGSFNELWSSSAAGQLPRATRLNLQGRLRWELTPGSVLVADVGAALVDRTELGTFLALPDARSRRSSQASLRYQQEGAGVLESWEVAARYLSYRLQDPELVEDDPLYSNSTTVFVGGTANLTFNERIRGNAGAEGYASQATAPFLSSEVSGTWRPWVAGYVNVDADLLSFLRLNLAGRVDYQTDDAIVMPSIRGSFIFSNEHGSIRASAMSSFRDPSFLERGVFYVSPDGSNGLIGVPDLKIPRNSTVELAGQWIPATNWSAQLVGSFGGGPISYPIVQAGPDTFGSLGYVRTFAEELQVEWKGPSMGVRGMVTLLQLFRPPETEFQVKENSSVLASLVMHGAGMGQRFEWSVGGTFASARSYATPVGLDSVVLMADLPAQVLVNAAARYRVFGPFSAFLRGQLSVPFEAVETPYPYSGQQGLVVMAGLEYQP